MAINAKSTVVEESIADKWVRFELVEDGYFDRLMTFALEHEFKPKALFVYQQDQLYIEALKQAEEWRYAVPILGKLSAVYLQENGMAWIFTDVTRVYRKLKLNNSFRIWRL